MTVNSPRIRSLLRQADRVASNGKRSAAEKLYRQIIEEAPNTAPAWTGLAQVVTDPAERESASRRALELEPGNEEAQRILVELLANELSDSTDGLAEGDAKSGTAEEDPYGQTREWLDAVTARNQQELASGSAAAATAIEPEIVTGTGDADVYDRDGETAEGAEGAAVLYCANHPNRQTSLRCNRCGKPICSSCARPTPVGYRCRECVRQHEDVFYTATPLHYVLAALIALPLAAIAARVALQLGFFVIFWAALAGSLVGRLVFRLIGRRRGRWLPHVVAAIVGIGGLVPAFPYLLALMLGELAGVGGLIIPGIYIVLAAGAAYYQMK